MSPLRRVLCAALCALFAACASPPAPTPTPAADAPPAPASAKAGAAPGSESPPRPADPGPLAASEEELVERVRLHPDNPAAWSAWAMAAWEAGRYATAVERYDRVLELEPGNRDARLNRGLAQFARKAYGPALQDFQAVLAAPSDPDLFTDYRLALRDYEERVARGEIDLPFPEAVRKGLLPVDRPAMFARWYGRIAAILLKGPGFDHEYRAESDHYVVVTDDSEGLARVTAGALELALREYERLFPPPSDREPPGKFSVTIFANRPDYVAYLSDLLDDRATAHLSGGSYHPLFRELILTKGPDLDRTLLVLLHEGFHQHLDSIVSGAPTWFGEGVADYFGASVLAEEGLVPGQLHPLRTADLAKALSAAGPETLESVLRADPETFMGGRVADFRARTALVGRNYALSWAFAHFLIESEYRPVLTRYYEAVEQGADAPQAFDEVFGPMDRKELFRRFVKHAREHLLPR